MPEPSKISLEWEYYVFVMIPFPGVSWDVCGADPLLGSQWWKLVKLPLPTLKGSAAVLFWKFYITFSISAFRSFFFWDIRWVEGVDPEPLPPLPATPPASTKRYWVGRLPIFNQPSPWLAQLTDSFGKSFGIQNSQRPGICRSSAIP